jgi:hypothetical protein
MSIEERDKTRIVNYIDGLLNQDTNEEGALNNRQKDAIRRICEAHDLPVRNINEPQSTLEDFIGTNTSSIALPLIPDIPTQHQMYDSYIIIGPPGTGKTTVIALGAIKYVLDRPRGHRRSRRTKIVVSTFSNAAAARIFEKFQEIFEENLNYYQYGGFCRRLIAQTRDIQRIPERQRPYILRPYPDDPRMAQTHRRDLENTLIYVGTLYACESLNRNGVNTNQVIFDEGSQITPPQLYYPISRNNNVIRIGLVGDNCQLPPIQEISLLSFSGIDYLRGQTIRDFGNSLIREENQIILDYQYRMHPAIRELAMRFSVEEGRVLNDGFNVLTEGHLLQNFNPLGSSEPYSDVINNIFHPQKTVVIIDTSGLGHIAEDEFEELSRINLLEIRIIQSLLIMLGERYPNLNINNENIKLISPYRAQADSLQEATNILSGTADKFQGQESPIVFLSMTFADYDSSSSFLADLRRLNVALSRAQKKLIIVGNQSRMNHRLFRRIRSEIFNYTYQGPPTLDYNPVYHLILDENIFNQLFPQI